MRRVRLLAPAVPDAGFSLVELLVTLALLGIVTAMSASFLLSGQTTVSAVQSSAGVTDTVRLLRQALVGQIRSASVVSPLPTGCTGSACSGLSTVVLLEQTAVGSQLCRGWKVVNGSQPTLQEASWAPGAPTGSYTVAAYLSTPGTFTVNGSAGLALVSFSFAVEPPPSPPPPAPVTAQQLGDSVAARNPSPGTDPC